MNKHLVILLSVFIVAGCQSTASQSDQATPQTTSAMLDSASLVEGMFGSLGVNSEQATGGVAALLSYAKNALPENSSQELTSLLNNSGSFDVSQISSSISSMSEVNSAFSALGLSPDMVSQFVPIALKFLQSEGASSTLSSAVTSLWS